MILGSSAEWVSAVIALLALFCAALAYRDSKKANETARETNRKEMQSIQKQLTPEPELIFTISAKVSSDGEPDGYELKCVNVGERPAILNVIHDWDRFITDKDKSGDPRQNRLGYYDFSLMNSKVLEAGRTAILYHGRKFWHYQIDNDDSKKEMCFQDSVGKYNYILTWTKTKENKITVKTRKEEVTEENDLLN